LGSPARTAPPLRLVTHIVDMAPEADERRFAEEVERQCGVEAHYIRCDDHTRFNRGEWLTPVNRSTLYLDVARRMAADGARVILSGRAGDGTMGNFRSDEGNLAGLLTAGAGVRPFLSHARAWSRASHDPIYGVITRSLAWFLPPARRIGAAKAGFIRRTA